MSGVKYILLFFCLGSIRAANLRDLAKSIYVGTCLNSVYMNDSHVNQMTGQQFNMVTPEWEMKWVHCEPKRGVYTYELADSIVAYAQKHDMRIRGHTLIWHEEMPDWLNGLDKSALHEAMESRVKHATTRYKGKIYAWDVVNEVIEYNGQLRNSTWSTHFGESFIADAFQIARKSDPAAKLYINDYTIEGINAKSNGLYNLVKKLKGQGVPIDGVGFQAHFSSNGVPSDFEENLKRFIALGVEVALTELDVTIKAPADQNKLQQQAKDFARAYTVCESFSKCVGVTVWGWTDRYSYNRAGMPCMWDDNFKPKPALAAVEAVLKNAVTHYRGKVYGWDVVNEVFESKGHLRNSTWSSHYGEAFIADAFYLAREADPAAKLYINDYGIESINPKSTGLFKLVKKLRQQGVPIDGVGFQCHLRAGAIPSNFEKNLRRFTDLGVEVAITELDMSIEVPADQSKLQQQAKDYASIYDICERISNCGGVTVWGWTDKYSWIKSREPCLWDQYFNPKPAVAAVEAVLK